MSATKKSSKPSRLMSAKSTAMEAKEDFRTARLVAALNRPLPSFIQIRSGEKKSLQTQRSGTPSPFKSRNIAERPQSRTGAERGLPVSSMKAPLVQETG